MTHSDRGWLRHGCPGKTARTVCGMSGKVCTSLANRVACGTVAIVSPDLEERLRAAEGLGLEDLVGLGCELSESGRLSEAEGCFRRASDLGSARASFNLGNCLAEQERWVEAVTFYEIALGRGETDAWLNLGLALQNSATSLGRSGRTRAPKRPATVAAL